MVEPIIQVMLSLIFEILRDWTVIHNKIGSAQDDSKRVDSLRVNKKMNLTAIIGD